MQKLKFTIKLILFICFFYSLNFTSIAQQYTYEINGIPPSPNSTSLGKYSNFPVNSFTGTPNISIPLYEIKEQDIHVPIQLSYHASGRKIEEISSQVGLGWSLFAGGVITRSVRGVPDDYFGMGVAPYGNRKHWTCSPNDNACKEKEQGQGYFYTGQYIKNKSIFKWWGDGKDAHKSEDRDAYPAPSTKVLNLCDAPAFDPNYLYLVDNDPNCTEIDLNNHRNVVAAYTQHISGKGLDTEPDIFHFNFNGYNGSFLFDKDQNIIQVPQSNLVIKRTDYNKEITSFKITTPDGFKYYFEEVEVSELESKFCTFNSIDCDPNLDFVSTRTTKFNSSWYLTKIESPLQGTLYFSYESDNISYNLRKNTARTSGDKTDAGWASSAIYLKLFITAKRLRKVHSANIELDFLPSSIYNYIKEGKAIERITVKNKIGSQIESIKFNYGYWISQGGTSDEYKRLRLDALIFMGELTNPKTYGFFYNDKVLPNRESLEQDIYGYYNANGSTSSLIPKIYVYPSLDKYNRYRVEKISGYAELNDIDGLYGKQYILEGQDRYVNPSVNQSCMLKSITYPTGGSTEFFYESNQYYDPSINQDILSGGLRVNKQISKAGGNAPPVVKNYYYTSENGFSSGKLINKPMYAYPTALFWIYYCPGRTCTPIPIGYSKDHSEYYNYNELVIRTSHSQNGLEEVQGSSTGYNRVIEEVPGNGSIENYFSFPLPFGMEKDDESFSNMTFIRDGSDMIKTEGLANWESPEVTNALADGFVWDGVYSGFEPPSRNYSAWRGLPLKTVTKNNDNKILKEEIYDYKPYRKMHNYTYKYAFSAFKISPAAALKGFGVGHWLEETQGYISHYNPFDTSEPKLIKKVIKHYDQNDASKNVSHETTYEYTLNFPTLIKNESSINSEQKKQIIKYNYPQDFPSNTVLKNMTDANHNILNQPIEIVTLKDEKVIDAAITNYNCLNCLEKDGTLTGGIFTISNIYNLEVDVPISDYQYASSSLGIDSRLKESLKYDAYDEKAKVLAFTPRDGITSSFQYGYNNQYPVAIIKGAKIKQAEYKYTQGTKTESFGGGGTTDTKTIHTFSFKVDYSGKVKLLFSIQSSISESISVTVSGSLSAIFSFSTVTTADCSNPSYVKEFNVAPGNYTMQVEMTSTAFSWGGCGILEYPALVPELISPKIQEFYYEGFEEKSIAATANPLVGLKYFSGDYTVPFIKPNSRQYVVDYLYLVGSTWSYIRKTYTDNMILSEGDAIDEVRVYPIDAVIYTYTYKPLVGMTSETDVNGSMTFYEYDDSGRLKFVKDNDGNIVKTYDYHYKQN